MLPYSSAGTNLISPEGVSITESGIQALTTTHSLIIHCITQGKRPIKSWVLLRMNQQHLGQDWLSAPRRGIMDKMAIDSLVRH